jgi:hypothetical protein
LIVFVAFAVVPLLFVRPVVDTVTAFWFAVIPVAGAVVQLNVSLIVTAALPAYPALVTRLDASTSVCA